MFDLEEAAQNHAVIQSTMWAGLYGEDIDNEAVMQWGGYHDVSAEARGWHGRWIGGGGGSGKVGGSGVSRGAKTPRDSVKPLRSKEHHMGGHLSDEHVMDNRTKAERLVDGAKKLPGMAVHGAAHIGVMMHHQSLREAASHDTTEKIKAIHRETIAESLGHAVRSGKGPSQRIEDLYAAHKSRIDQIDKSEAAAHKAIRDGAIEDAAHDLHHFAHEAASAGRSAMGKAGGKLHDVAGSLHARSQGVADKFGKAAHAHIDAMHSAASAHLHAMGNKTSGLHESLKAHTAAAHQAVRDTLATHAASAKAGLSRLHDAINAPTMEHAHSSIDYQARQTHHDITRRELNAHAELHSAKVFGTYERGGTQTSADIAHATVHAQAQGERNAADAHAARMHQAVNEGALTNKAHPLHEQALQYGKDGQHDARVQRVNDIKDKIASHTSSVHSRIDNTANQARSQINAASQKARGISDKITAHTSRAHQAVDRAATSAQKAVGNIGGDRLKSSVSSARDSVKRNAAAATFAAAEKTAGTRTAVRGGMAKASRASSTMNRTMHESPDLARQKVGEARAAASRASSAAADRLSSARRGMSPTNRNAANAIKGMRENGTSMPDRHAESGLRKSVNDRVSAVRRGVSPTNLKATGAISNMRKDGTYPNRNPDSKIASSVSRASSTLNRNVHEAPDLAKQRVGEAASSVKSRVESARAAGTRGLDKVQGATRESADRNAAKAEFHRENAYRHAGVSMGMARMADGVHETAAKMGADDHAGVTAMERELRAGAAGQGIEAFREGRRTAAASVKSKVADSISRGIQTARTGGKLRRVPTTDIKPQSSMATSKAFSSKRSAGSLIGGSTHTSITRINPQPQK